jgi:hypothetical protein
MPAVSHEVRQDRCPFYSKRPDKSARVQAGVRAKAGKRLFRRLQDALAVPLRIGARLSHVQFRARCSMRNALRLGLNRFAPAAFLLAVQFQQRREASLRQAKELEA